MSLNKNSQLRQIAKKLCRELRKNSTPAEKIFWEVVRNRKFMNKKFYRQYPLFFDLNGKETFFIADFFCYDEQLVVEIDGGYHERQKDYDKLRTEIINNLGIEVIRFKNNSVIKETEKVKEELKEYITPTKKSSPLSEKRGAGGELHEIQRV
ncbi:MAG: endonuclease domain-containing protein [Ignavibacteria bacterium]|jgi:very-short-patch-repair endonuclease